MSVDLIKERLHSRIEQADEKLLRVLDQFAETLFAEYHNDEEFIGYQAGELITVSELHAKINRAEEQIDKGEFLTIEQLEKESDQWLKEDIG